MWDAFVASLVDEYAHGSDGDRVLWRATKPDREVLCRVREIRMGDGYVGVELRVEHNGQVFHITELHRERVAFNRRVDELRELLIAEGWTTAQARPRE